MSKSKVSVLRVSPATVLRDIDRLCGLADLSAALERGAATILKDNISWHYPFPGANTTPWQLEGTILALRRAGFRELSCVQNKTVVTDAFKGEDLNHYRPICAKHEVPVLYNFREEDMRWIEYRPRARMRALQHVFPEGIHLPDYFFGKNVVHLPTMKCHIYTTTTGAMKNAFGGLLSHKRPLHPQLDSPNLGGPRLEALHRVGSAVRKLRAPSLGDADSARKCCAACGSAANGPCFQREHGTRRAGRRRHESCSRGRHGRRFPLA